MSDERRQLAALRTRGDSLRMSLETRLLPPRFGRGPHPRSYVRLISSDTPEHVYHHERFGGQR